MAIAFGAISAVSTSSTPTSVTVSGSNTLGIFFVHGDTTTDNITAVTWGGVSMTKIAAVQTPSDRWISAWYIANPASAASIVITGAASWRSFSSYYTGASATQVDSSNTGTSTGTSNITVATTVVASNCWTIMMQKDIGGGITYSTSVGVMRVNTDAGGHAISDSNGTVGTGSQSTTLSGTGSPNHGAIAISIAPFVAVTSIPDARVFFM